MNKIISFSLWGDDPKYQVGALRNAELAKIIYPDWKCRFYISDEIPNGITFQLEDAGAELVFMNEPMGTWRALFWRFLALKDTDICLIRDCDSRLGQREKSCVEEWLKSEKGMHSIFDHPWHQRSNGIMPGLFGVKKDAWTTFEEDLQKWFVIDGENRICYGLDYRFFSYYFASRIKEDLLIHDGINPGIDGAFEIPNTRVNLEFVGQVYNEQEKILREHLWVLHNYLRQKEMSVKTNEK